MVALRLNDLYDHVGGPCPGLFPLLKQRLLASREIPTSYGTQFRHHQMKLAPLS